MIDCIEQIRHELLATIYWIEPTKNSATNCKVPRKELKIAMQWLHLVVYKHMCMHMCTHVSALLSPL